MFKDENEVRKEQIRILEDLINVFRSTNEDQLQQIKYWRNKYTNLLEELDNGT